MDEYEVIYLDDDERNAARDHRRSTTTRRHGGRRVVVPASNRPTIIRGLSTGELIELAAQLLAAIQPLPGAPSAQGHVETDVENLVVYQTALATHAKRDEQLRTLGGLLGRLLK
jgi:hypothetical protein